MDSNNFKRFAEYFLYSVCVYFVMGWCIKYLAHFVRVVQKKGAWRIDWVKLAAVGIPTLAIILSYLIYWTPFSRFFYIQPSFQDHFRKSKHSQHSKRNYLRVFVVFCN